jgi:hypothetical protein
LIAVRVAYRSLPWIVVVGIFLVASGWIFSHFVGIALFRYPDFDGALNLNVAKSLLEGHGYRSFYNDWVPFFPETNGPYIFPATVSIALFGVSPIGAQLVNLLYLIALLALVYALVARLANRLAAVIAVFVVLQTPGLDANGMNGYGEVPALAFLFAACLVLRIALVSDDRRGVAIGGTLLALSYLTKTVSLIWIPVTVIAFLVARPRDRRAGDAALLFVAIALPVLAWEAYRLATLHSLSGYADWWRVKFDDILDRAGPNTRLKDTPGWWNKAQMHLALLEVWLGFPARWFTSAYLASAIFAGLAALRRWHDDAGGRFVFLALFATATIYLAWWILLTPTQEAWLRRVMNGLIAGEIVAIVAIYKLLASRNALTAVALAFVASGSVFTVFHNQLLWDRPNDQAQNAANRVFFERVAALPHDAQLYAAAWYQSPVAAFTTDRRFYDITRSSNETHGHLSPRFLVIEQVALYQRGWLAEVLSRCECEPIFVNSGGRIYRVHSIGSDANHASMRTAFVTADGDGFGAGFYAGDPDTRWAAELSRLRLPVSDFDELVLWLHAPRQDQMTSGPGPSFLEVRRGDCVLMREQLAAGENQLLIKNSCRDRYYGDTLEFRMNGHLTSAAAGQDTRQLSWLFRNLELTSRQPSSKSHTGQGAGP